ncbi:MAG: hypothetical protein GF344_04140 [Chitinivibrionales bacterium]|nr:hypothetical protein [Chitinivibrionales bacterium]MBD3356241.1 hypothetical protein [Chitinivibrionales bacterium]
MMKNIIAAIDLENERQRNDILRVAAEYASAFNAKLWILHVALDSPGPADFEAGPQTVRDRVSFEARTEHRELQNLAKKTAEENGIEATPLMIKGLVADEILEHAERRDAELIVVGHRHRSGLVAALMGDPTRDVLGKAKRPVLVVP